MGQHRWNWPTQSVSDPETNLVEPANDAEWLMATRGPATETTRLRSERGVIGYLAFMGILLAFGIDASLPAFDELRQAFGIGETSPRISLIVTFYFIGMACGQLFYGPIADRFGRSPAVAGGVALYSLGAIGSIISPSFEILLASRLVWGLGAAAPGALRATIARDLYRGDQMARVISTMMGVFMLGPVIAPLLGQGILAVGSWRWVFGSALVLAGVQLVWTWKFGETLDPAKRRPLDPGEILRGFRIVFGNRATLGYTMALTFGFGAFIVFLGSSQPIIETIYARGDQFAFWFGIAGILMAAAFFSVNRFIDRHGAHRVAVTATAAAIACSAVLLVASLAQGGTPQFGVWFALIAISSSLITLLTPTGYSLGLEPMGELAGTASGVMGFISTAGASALAALVDSSIVGTVTPMALGYVIYGTIALAFLIWANQPQKPSALT